MRSPLLLLLVCVTVGCDAPPVDWADPVVIPATGGGRLVVDTAGHARFVNDSSLGAPTAVTLGAAGVCPSSVRRVRGLTALRAVWWGIRADSSAVLYLAASADSGRTWDAPRAIDTADVSIAGCVRPPPAVAAVGDDVHVAYSMKASEGTGVFFAHYLSSMIHSPVAVVYGDRLVPTAIAADDRHVVVAYESPNGARRRVDIAISSTQGHIFETHTTASRDVDEATDPAVAVAGPRIAVSWATADTAATRVVRVGRIR